jgi:hypothetical protein
MKHYSPWRRGYLPDFEIIVERFFNDRRKDRIGVVLSTSLPFTHEI